MASRVISIADQGRRWCEGMARMVRSVMAAGTVEEGRKKSLREKRVLKN